MWMCVTTISLLLLSSAYSSNISLAVSYYLECRRAYVSDIVLNCFSCALGDSFRTSNSLSMREFDNEKSINFLGLFLMLSIYVFMYFISFYFCFICFATVSQFHWRFGRLTKKD